MGLVAFWKIAVAKSTFLSIYLTYNRGCLLQPALALNIKDFSKKQVDYRHDRG